MHPVHTDGVTPQKNTTETVQTHELRTSPLIDKTDKTALDAIAPAESTSVPPLQRGAPLRPMLYVDNGEDEDEENGMDIDSHQNHLDTDLNSSHDSLDVDSAAPKDKSFTLERVHDRLAKFDTQLDALNSEIDKIQKDTIDKAKEMHDKKKIHQPTINHLPKEELLKFELDLRLKGERFQSRINALNSMIQNVNEANFSPEEHKEILDKVKELEKKFTTAYKKLDDQLSFHTLTRLARMLQKVAEIMHRLNEEMNEVLNIRG